MRIASVAIVYAIFHNAVVLFNIITDSYGRYTSCYSPSPSHQPFLYAAAVCVIDSFSRLLL